MHFQTLTGDMRRSCRDPYYVQIILEYLLHAGLIDSATVLQQECDRERLNVPYNDGKAGDAVILKLLELFDCREEDPFFQVFYSSSPDKKCCHKEDKILFADLYLYFSSKHDTRGQSTSADTNIKYPVLLTACDASPSFAMLSKFLDRECNNLRDDPEFIPFFSLMGASNPWHHYLLQQTYKDDWISNLRRRFHEYLCLHHPASKVPKIVQYLPSKAKISFSCCSQHQETATDGNEKDPFYQESEDIVKADFLDLNGSTFNSHSSQNETDSHQESDKQHMVHSHKNSSLFIRRQNQNMSTSSHKPTGRSVSSTESCGNHEKDEEYQHSYEQLKKKFNQLHSDYHNLIGVASELTCALENSVRGQQIDLRQTLNSCLQIFPDLFPHKKLQKKSKKKTRHDNNTLKSTSYEWNLHIARIKKHLVDGSVKTRLLLLQALRWAITRSSSEKRECIMSQLVSFDVLDLQGKTLIASLLMPPGVVTPHPLQQSAARLLNTFASIQSGRSYLAQNSVVVKVTSAVLQQEDGIFTDLITKNMLVAALQKLSLRRTQRTVMIQSGVVEWLFQQLSNIDHEASYSLEYGSALLMNLCLHQSAKERCLPMAGSVLTLLIGLLATPVTQALPYINGTLYSLITHPQLNETAAEVGFSKALELSILRQTNTEIKTQMEHILKYHQSLLQSDKANSFPLPISEGELIDEDDEELDLLGEELDENDPVRSIGGELNGEDLLHTHYSLSSQSDGYVSENSLMQVHEGYSSPLILRPTTPHHFSQNFSGDTELVEVGKCEATSRTQELNKTYNWKSRRAGILQPKVSNQHGDGSFRPETSDGVNNGTRTKSEHSEQRLPSYSIIGAREQDCIFEVDKQKDLPEISIHLTGTEGSSESENNFVQDDDLDDVQVAPMTRGSHDQTMKTSVPESSSVDKEHEDLPKNGEATAAFTSRPKIPRTPPHHP